MKVLGYYLDSDTAACSDCWEHDGKYEFRGYRWSIDPEPIMSSTESDTPTHCSFCGDLIEHALTGDGYTYVLDAMVDEINEGVSRGVVALWAAAYYPSWRNDVNEQRLRELHDALPTTKENT